MCGRALIKQLSEIIVDALRFWVLSSRLSSLRFIPALHMFNLHKARVLLFDFHRTYWIR